MPRRRKVAVAVDDDSEKMKPPPPPPPLKKKPVPQTATTSAAAAANQKPATENNVRRVQTHPIFQLFENAQANESLHGKYIKELAKIYEKMEHGSFMVFFLKGLKKWVRYDESNHYANTGLRFSAKFVTSFNDDEDTHPILSSTFSFLLSTISPVTTVRFRLCQFVNLLLSSMSAEAALDDTICNDIMKYMTDRLKDYVASVRVQAVQALQRLQQPDNPNDIIVRLYIFHLANDTSPLVRQAVLTAMGRNTLTIPAILERLWDIDDRVRRHTYIQMSTFPVKAYKVVQRITFLEQGLNDHSEIVRKAVTKILLPNWLQAYNNKYLAFVSALKLDANEEEVKRFMKIAKQALFEIFKTEKIDKLIEALPLNSDGEFERCIPFDKLTVEVAVYWLALIEYLQQLDPNEDLDDRLGDCVCELSTFCNYLAHCCNLMREQAVTDTDRWSIQENQYKFITLIDILLTFDLGDEIGRQNLKAFISNILTVQIVNENNIHKLVQCIENIIPDRDMRLQYFIEIVRGIVDPNTSIDFTNRSITSLIEAVKDPNVKVKISALKLKILDLREQESIASQQKNYERLEKITEDLSSSTEEFIRLVNETGNLLNSSTGSLLSSLQSKKVSVEWIQQCLLICFYAVASKHTDALTPNMCQLYKDFIRRQMESKQMVIRDWALKCGTAFSKLYEQLAKDVYNELHKQFYRHQNPRIWTTCINATFELIDQFGFDYFEADGDGEKSMDKTKKTRQLYNTMGYLDEPDEDEMSLKKSGVELMYLFGHFLDTCSDTSIVKALITGFCRLVLGGHYESSELVSKLMLKFFNPATDPEINQILGIFFETLIKRRRQECLAKALLPTLTTIVEAPNDSPLQEIKPETVIKFVINSTIPSYCSPGLNIHNDIAMSFLNVMNDNNNTNKDLLKILSKELLTLEISDDQTLRNDLQQCSDDLLERTIDGKTETYIKSFKEILAGTYKGNTNAQKTQNDNPDQDEQPSDDEMVGDNNVEGKEATDGATTAATKNINDNETEIDEDIVDTSNMTRATAELSSIRPDSSNFIISSQIDVSEIHSSTEVKAQNRGKHQRQRSVSDEENTSNSVKVSRTAVNRPETSAVKPKTTTRAKSIPPKTNTVDKDAAVDKGKAIQSTQISTTVNNVEDNSSSSSDNDDNENLNTTIPNTPDVPPIEDVRKKRKAFVPKNTNLSPRLPKKQGEREDSKNARLSNLNVNSSYRTRNALVAEFKNRNIMTRKRQTLDQIKSPTRRIEHLKKIANNTLPTVAVNRIEIRKQSPIRSKSLLQLTTTAVNSRSNTSDKTQNNNKSPPTKAVTKPPQNQTQTTKVSKLPAPTQIPVRINGLKRGRTKDDTDKKSKPMDKTPPKHFSTPIARRQRSQQRPIESPTASPPPKRKSFGQKTVEPPAKTNQTNNRNLRLKKSKSTQSISTGSKELSKTTNASTTEKSNKTKLNVLGTRSNSLISLRAKEAEQKRNASITKKMTAANTANKTNRTNKMITRKDTANHCSIRPRKK